MQCPSCPDTSLSMASREGIEIDYCPKCRGVWLDRGELDKIIDRAATQSAGQPAAAPPQVSRQPQGDYRHHDDDDHYRYGKYGKHGKRRGLLGELFDFD